MQTLDKILELARKLPAEDRRRLIDELDLLEQHEPTPNGAAPYSALMALAGTIHSDFADLSTNKYEHLGAVVAEHKAK